ncbi:uncharacterized protein TNCV_2739371 [Trichonephila clavipes]|nr:uncharacterized protein TNCV_2739371 [Trichonephila clavipes]
MIYVSEEELRSYDKQKNLVLKEFQPTSQECYNDFRKTQTLNSENYVQFASRLSATFEYYCQLRNVNEFKSLCELIVADKMMSTLDRELSTHINVKQGETFFNPHELGRECDTYLSSKGNSLGIALKRLNALLLRTEKDTQYLKLYREFMQEYEQLGHMREMTLENDNPKMNYFLPHRDVYRPEKSTTKVSDRGLLCHGFEPCTTKDPPCRAAMHVKSVDYERGASGVVHVSMVKTWSVAKSPRVAEQCDINIQSIFSRQNETKTSGVSWDPVKDPFSFTVDVIPRDSYTKRSVLSTIARLFDP